MKRKGLFLAMLLTATVALAKDIRTLLVTTQPQMHCESCENRIKGNLRFERGVKKIETNIPQQCVTITYDAEKTTPEKLIESFTRFGYTATELPADSTRQQQQQH
ncbi:MAG: heavy-metal-associated domain-containing protein [Prevotella sp.]|nr:heavy-metal-associated domain-containing protein [Prevotella sp.]